MKVIYFDYWTVQDVKDRPDHLFIFGDNNVAKGKGGQAIIRDEPNALGIPTKKYPSNRATSFYTDDEYEDNKTRIDEAIRLIIEMLPKYEVLVLPKDGFGTGLAQLPKKAPKTYRYLKKKVKELVKEANYVRRVPSMNSNQVPIGSKMKGNDGNLYQSIMDKGGSRRWKLIMKCDGESCQFVNDSEEETDDEVEEELTEHGKTYLPQSSDEWTVYGASYCGYCRLSIDLLKEKGEQYRYVDMSEYKLELFSILQPMIGNHRTIPIIFHRGNFIGGYSQLKAFLG